MDWDGEITMAGHEMLAKLMSGDRSDVAFDKIRICDDNGDEIATDSPSWSAEEYTDDDYEGWRVKGQATFDSGDVTSDIHKIELVNSDDEVIATKDLSDPWPSGEGVIINRRDYFVNEV